MTPFRWGIFGTGAISAKFVAGLASAENAEVGFIASRSTAKAEAFAAAIGVEQAIAGYAEAAAHGGVDAVYIATPPSEHVAHALMCIEAGIPVLVEKPFALNAGDARRVVTAAAERHVFAMEGMWTRFLPASSAMKQQIDAGGVGDVRVVAGSFGSSNRVDPGASMFDPTLGGGALSHLAPYPLSLAQWLFGTPTSVQATGITGAGGVDDTVAFQLRYPGDVVGSFYVSIGAWGSDDFQVLGSHGSLRIRGSLVRPHGFNLSRELPIGPAQSGFGMRARLRQHSFVHAVAQRMNRSSRSGDKRHNVWYSGNGYHYEADEVRACVQRGQHQSSVMPLGDSVAVAVTMDEIRAQIRTAATKGSQ